VVVLFCLQVFPFCYAAAEPFAIKALELDPELQKLRFKLLRPGKLTREEQFWRPYFYRVFEMRREMGLELLFDITQDLGATAANAENKPMKPAMMSLEEEKTFSKQVQELMDEDFVNIPTPSPSNLTASEESPAELVVASQLPTPAQAEAVFAAAGSGSKDKNAADVPASKEVDDNEELSLDNLESMLADVDVGVDVGDNLEEALADL